MDEQLKHNHKLFLLKHGQRPVLVVWHPGKYRKDALPDVPVDTSIQEGTFWFELAEKKK